MNSEISARIDDEKIKFNKKLQLNGERLKQKQKKKMEQDCN